MSDRFDLEQQIISCWYVVDDVRDIADSVSNWDSLNPKHTDEIINLLLAVQHLYDMRFQKLFNIFENCIKDGDL